MFNWNDLKNLDVKDVDITRIDLTRFDVRNMDLSKFEMPKFEMPDVDLPELPADLDSIVGFARDAAYAGVGAAVITVQKLDEQRRELSDQVATQVRKLVDAVA